MIARCTNRKRDNWKFYGAKGVGVCRRWSSPEHGYKNFLADIGPKPTPLHSLGRFLDLGNYEPSNVKWMTVAEQKTEARKKREFLQQAA